MCWVSNPVQNSLCRAWRLYSRDETTKSWSSPSRAKTAGFTEINCASQQTIQPYPRSKSLWPCESIHVNNSSLTLMSPVHRPLAAIDPDQHLGSALYLQLLAALDGYRTRAGGAPDNHSDCCSLSAA